MSNYTERYNALLEKKRAARKAELEKAKEKNPKAKAAPKGDAKPKRPAAKKAAAKK